MGCGLAHRHGAASLLSVWAWGPLRRHGAWGRGWDAHRPVHFLLHRRRLRLRRLRLRRLRLRLRRLRLRLRLRRLRRLQLLLLLLQ